MSYIGLTRNEDHEEILGTCEVCGAALEDRGGYEPYGDTRVWRAEVVCPNDCPSIEDWQEPNEHELGDQPLVFVAGPYTSDPEGNTRRAIAVAEALVKLGFVPFIPHLTHYWDVDVERRWGSRKSPSWWYEYDYVFLRKCDALFRFPGESSGADNEVRLAKKLGIPVFEDYASLVSAKDQGDLK